MNNARTIRRLAWLAAMLVPVAATAQGPADPEIYLASLTVKGGTISIGTPVNITNRRGYDNQPAFTADGRSILYTSTREDGQADIYRYDIAGKRSERLTRTNPESEYSATPIAGSRFTVIRVERDSAQRLWSFAADGSDPRVVLTDIKPVGYHAWVDDTHLALFVLGTPSSTLQFADARTGKAMIVAHDIGRSLLPMPGGHAFSFLMHQGQDWVLTEAQLSPSRDSVRLVHPLVTLPKGMDYVAWIGDRAIGGTGTSLMTWTRGGSWTPFADLTSAGLWRLSRITVSRDHRWVAFVAEPAPKP